MTRTLASLLLAFICSSTHAYKVGDSVDPTVLNKLGVDHGKITVVDFFAEWCSSCRKEIPLISALNSRIDKKAVEIMGVDADDTLAAASAFQKELQAKGALNFRVSNDIDQSLVRLFKPKGFPALYLLKDGKVASIHFGAMPDIDQIIETDLQKLGN
ncbi:MULTISPECIES: TlpA disulfide reductase family protein [unclassified Iodobacter]|uniref:TlpA family protein disulfide reductase n=1 Tax=unclassified Iodobacter TaxID=235634 RepID=UPI0025DD62DD|nr:MULTISPECIES: TlpA disulfide reductase family protein [unclassified Iodobacter]MDW5415631.1 TlpA disulfide reductase family protein [Iodobacter sp. CM08]